MSFLTLSYTNILGFLSFIMYLLQLVSGILSSIHYNDFFITASDPIIYLIINTNNGWFIRILHVIGASLSLLSILLHLIRAIWIKSKIIYCEFNSLFIMISGWIILALTIIEGFLGHIPCRGQMPYWGITVTTNIIPALPCLGIVIAELIRSAAWVILNRIFVYHLLIGMIIPIIILIHIVILHSIPSSNPSINNNSVIIGSYPFISKDIYSSFISIIISLPLSLYWEPDISGSSDNQIIANPLTTPNNILPEWYHLLFHSILRSSPDKTIGVIIVLNIPILLPYWCSNNTTWIA